MAEYKNLKHLRQVTEFSDFFTKDAIEAGIRLGAEADHLAIKKYIMKLDTDWLDSVSGGQAVTQVLTFMSKMRTRAAKREGGLGKPAKKKATKKKP